eukprot:6912584-Prymnesium_polylepis.3
MVQRTMQSSRSTAMLRAIGRMYGEKFGDDEDNDVRTRRRRHHPRRRRRCRRHARAPLIIPSHASCDLHIPSRDSGRARRRSRHARTAPTPSPTPLRAARRRSAA